MLGVPRSVKLMGQKTIVMNSNMPSCFVFKDVTRGIPKSDLLGVIVARIHVAGQWFLAV